MSQELVPEEFLFGFDLRFLEDHAGPIVTDPEIAIVELVANAYDAGATQVRLTWPDQVSEPFLLEDNGTGMSRQELEYRWTTLCYDRTRAQGEQVEFPKGARATLRRTAFGRNGKGRFGGFCFSDQYSVTTTKNGKTTSADVALTKDPRIPFALRNIVEANGDRHGTRISAVVERHWVPPSRVRDVLASRFLIDAEFAIILDGSRLELSDIPSLQTEDVPVGDYGKLTIHRIDSMASDRSTHLHGVSWWTKRRMVGEPAWDVLEGEGAYLDGRSAEARRYGFVIEADFLHPKVKADWTGFHADAVVNAARLAAHDYISEAIARLSHDSRRRKKRAALEANKRVLGHLSPLSRATVGRFVEEVQEKCPTLTPRDLGRTVQVFARFEEARSGYNLLHKLAACSADDIDTWNDIMAEWSASNARIVLAELHRRLQLIEQLQKTVEAIEVDELHDIQPLFERGLWMFGPAYEAVDFRANRGMAEVVRKFFGQKEAEVTRRRPDLVALPASSIGPYAAPMFDDAGEVNGWREVLIVELKATGVALTQAEIDQARDYAIELQRTGAVQRGRTSIVAYVLGTTIDPMLSELTVQGVTVWPMTYQTVLEKAHARTFNLQRRIEETSALELDSDAEELAATGDDDEQVFDYSAEPAGATSQPPHT